MPANVDRLASYVQPLFPVIGERLPDLALDARGSQLFRPSYAHGRHPAVIV
jgi:hypothetical protein